MPKDYLNLIHYVPKDISDISDKEYMDLMEEWVQNSMNKSFIEPSLIICNDYFNND